MPKAGEPGPIEGPSFPAARARRAEVLQTRNFRLEWFADQVVEKLSNDLAGRVEIATNVLKDAVVRNISVPVTKVVSPKTGRVRVMERSKPGEFPRADTTRLMKSIFAKTARDERGPVGYVGTPLDYGLYLELRLERQFLTRTLKELAPLLKRMIAGRKIT